MITVKSLRDAVQLAEASYVLFDRISLPPHGTPVEDGRLNDALREADLQGLFTEEQGAALAAAWSLVSHQPNTATGFSASLFQQKDSPSTYVLAIRGTELRRSASEFIRDFVESDLGGVIYKGVALGQIVDLYNYWKCAVADRGQTVRLARIVPTSDANAANVFAPALDGLFYRIEFFDRPDAGLGVFDGPISSLTVTGHSLGGHLSTAFSRLFPDANAEVVTVNSMGTGESTLVQTFFDVLAERNGTQFDDSRIANLVGSAGPDIAAGEVLYTQHGVRAEIYTESASIGTTAGHGIGQMTDSASVYDLFIRADSALQVKTPAQVADTLFEVFEAASPSASLTLESLENVFGDLFVPGYSAIAEQFIDHRGVLHQTQSAIRDAMPSSGLTMVSLTSSSAAALSNLATNGDLDAKAYRYALKEGNPFAVLAGSIYETHNASAQLELHDPRTGAGALSDVWIQDRATLLTWKVRRNLEDNRGFVLSGGSADTTAIFIDRPNDPLRSDTIQVVSATQARMGVAELAIAKAPIYVFGDAQAEQLSGGASADHLFGEGGDDTLIGGFGNDYLEGGRGSDTYVYTSGHGLDTVLDVDGAGRVLFDGIALGSGERVAPYQWRFTSEVGREFFYWLSNEKDGSRSITITAAETPGSIRVLGHRDGSLGILLHDFMPDERPAGEIEAGTQGNDILNHPFQPVKVGLGGDDILWGKPDFWLEGGSGNDWLAYAYSIGDPARGLSAYGGEGSDLLFGTVYEDELHAEDVADFAALVSDASSSEASAEREVLFGGAGDDVVAGGRGNDWVAGGIGSDVLHGGAGDDILSGAGEIFIEVTQPGLDPQAATIFNVHTSGRYDQTHPAIRINVPHNLLDFGFTAADLGTVLREGLDESGWRDGADIVLAGPGDDEAWGGFGDDFISGDEGNDTLIGESGNDALYGGDGDDHLLGGEGNDILAGGAGADLLEGGAGDDTYEVDPFDTVRDTNGNNRIRFGTEVRRDTLHALQSGATLILTGVGGGTLTIEAGLTGAIAEVDIEQASLTIGEFLSSIAAEPLHIQGGPGNEALFGASGNDRIASGKGFDVMEGGRGNDVYELNLGDGFDVLTDMDGRNVIEFGAGINASHVTASVLFNSSTGSYDMYVGYGVGDMVAITYGHAGAIAEYRFDNAEVLTHADVVARAAQGFSLAGSEAADVLFGGGGNDSLTGDGGDDVLIGQAGNDSMSGANGDDRLSGGEGNDRLFGHGGADMLNGENGDDELVGGEGDDLLEGSEGNDLLKGEAGNDMLQGGAGNDLLEGGAGDDLYLVKLGDGTDILRDVVGFNTIRFAEAITPESLSGSILNGTDGGIYLSLEFGGSDRLLVRQDPLRPGSSDNVFSFASGENLTQVELMARTLSTPLDYVAGPNALTLYGSRFDDRVLGSEQPDFIDGGAGNDLLQGEGGADILAGGTGDDVLLGGTGDDRLRGGPGSDIYALRQGIGRDTVTEDPDDAGINTIVLSAGLTVADLAADRQGEHLYLHLRNVRDGVVIADYFAAPDSADAWQVQTGDGNFVPLNAAIAGIQETPRATSVAQAFEQFEQRVRAASASALHSAGWIPRSDGRFHLESTFDSRFFSSHVVREVGIRTVTQAADGAFVLRQSQPVLLTGRTVSESLASQTVQVLDTSNSRVVPVQDGGSAELMAGEPMTVVDVEDLVQSGLSGIELPHTVIPIYDGQTVARTYSADPTPKRQVSSVATYTGGATPIYTPQTVTHRQQEVLEYWEMQIAGIVAGDSDSIVDARSGSSLVDAGAGNDFVLAQGGMFLPNLEMRADGIPGALLYGNAGDDELRGSQFDDVLIGGPDNDTLRGGKGNDVYIVFNGDGNDLIFDDGETVSGTARANIIEMPDGVSLADLTVTHATVLQAGRYAAANHDSLVVSPYVALDLAWGNGALRIVVPHTDQNAAMGIESVRFAEGSSATLEELFGRTGGVPDLNPHNHDNMEPGIVWGGGGDDVLHGNGVIGGAGRDTLIGSESDDELFGGEMVLENELADLTGGSASLSTLWDEGNIYRGGRGDDTLWATAGSDVFEYDIGGGADTVTDMLHDNTFLHGYGGPIGSAQHHLPHWQDPTAVNREHQALLFSGSDTLKFGPGISPRDVEVYRWGESGLKPHLLFAVSSGGVRFDNWYRAQINQLGRVEFTDGTLWDSSAIAARAFEARILVRGSDADDIFVGGPEDEAFQGGKGSDTYRFGAGSGQDLIRETASTADTDTLEVLASPGDVIVTRENDNLVVALEDGADRVAIEWFRAADARIEQVTFADDTVWDAQALEAQVKGATNQAPAVAHPVPDQQAVEDVPLTYIVPEHTFNEPDAGDALTYTAGNLPEWLSFDPATRTFSGTPLNQHVGSYPVHVIATDSGGLAATDEFVLTVLNVNDAPSVVVPLEPRLSDAGSPFVFAVPASTFADPDAGDSLTLSASLFGGGALPVWLSFDPVSSAFSGTPQEQHIGVWHLAVTAIDLADESASSDFGLIVRSQADATLKGDSGDDLLYGNTGDETLIAKVGNDYLFGDAGSDLLKGGTGNDILQGGDGSDVLRAGTGTNLLDGGAGDDLIYSGAGSSLIIGGTGNDTIRTGHGADVILFNRGDGRDTIIADRTSDNTLSFGGGIRYSDLTFAREGKDLIVDAGGGDQVTLKDWYAGKQSVLNLQIIHDASKEFDATSTDPLYNRKVQTFDFRGMARSFDGVSEWALSDALLQWHLANSDDAALGGDLAYWYGRNRGLSGISIQAAQQVLGAPGFGSDAHSLRPFEGLKEGLAKLA